MSNEQEEIREKTNGNLNFISSLMGAEGFRKAMHGKFANVNRKRVTV